MFLKWIFLKAWASQPLLQKLKLVSGGRHEGSKRNLKFQNATWLQTPSQ
jgi:hypothetical protein